MARYPSSLAFFALIACAAPERAQRASDSDDGMEPVEVDAAAIIADAQAYREQLTQLSTEPQTSETHSDAASVLVWGSAAAADQFLAIDPEDPTQELEFAPGTMFVKEQFDASGNRLGITVMFKADPGYDDAGRDWFWARVWGTEVTHQGHVESCRDCHEAAYNTDLVVGFDKSQ